MLPVYMMKDEWQFMNMTFIQTFSGGPQQGFTVTSPCGQLTIQNICRVVCVLHFCKLTSQQCENSRFLESVNIIVSVVDAVLSGARRGRSGSLPAATPETFQQELNWYKGPLPSSPPPKKTNKNNNKKDVSQIHSMSYISHILNSLASTRLLAITFRFVSWAHSDFAPLVSPSYSQNRVCRYKPQRQLQSAKQMQSAQRGSFF